MSWTPTSLRGENLVWLCDIVIGGQTYHLADRPVTAPTGEDDANVEYRGGLEFSGDVDDRLDLFTADADERSVSLTLHLAGQADVRKLIREGADLLSATGRLMLYVEGGSASDVVVLVDGVADAPEYGAEEQPVTLTLREDRQDDAALIPPEPHRYTSSTWAGTGDTGAYGERYPIVFGRPGGLFGFAAGSPGLYVETDTMLIAGHHVDSTTTISLMDGDGVADGSLVVTNTTDDLGQPVATISTAVLPNIGAITVGDPYFVRWGGDAMMDGSRPVRGAGSVIRWLLRRSSMRWDSGRLAAAEPHIDRYLIDAYIGAAPEKRVSPWEWIADHLTPILPISWRIGPRGIYPVLWRFDATALDATAEIDVDGARASRTSAVAYSDRAKIRNDLVLSYSPDKDGAYLRKVRVTGDYDAIDIGTLDLSTAHVSPYCVASRLRYGPRPMDLSSDVIEDGGTAGAVLGWMVRRYALPTRTVSFELDQTRLADLTPGDVVTVLDAEIGMVSQVALVESVRYAARGAAEVTVRTVEDIVRDRL
ncbi:MAG: hypothetical protein ACO3AV_11750 [Ilumatobacteraceae bacterium]